MQNLVVKEIFVIQYLGCKHTVHVHCLFYISVTILTGSALMYDVLGTLRLGKNVRKGCVRKSLLKTPLKKQTFGAVAS